MTERPGGDARAARILIVGAAMSRPGALAAVEAEGYGLIQTPPETLPPAQATLSLVLIVDQIEDYRRHGYLVLARPESGAPGGGIWLDSLQRMLAERGLAPLDLHD